MSGYLHRESILLRMEASLIPLPQAQLEDYAHRLISYADAGMTETWMGGQGLSAWDRTSLDLDALSRAKLRRRLAIKRGALV